MRRIISRLRVPCRARYDTRDWPAKEVLRYPVGPAVCGKPLTKFITRTITWAKEAGIPVVHAGDGRKPDALSDADALKVLSERLAAILEVAEKCQVYLAIEPQGTFSLTADGLNKIMAVSQSKWLGINYDTANVHRATYAETANGGYSGAVSLETEGDFGTEEGQKLIEASHRYLTRMLAEI